MTDSKPNGVTLDESHDIETFTETIGGRLAYFAKCACGIQVRGVDAADARMAMGSRCKQQPIAQAIEAIGKLRTERGVTLDGHTHHDSDGCEPGGPVARARQIDPEVAALCDRAWRHREARELTDTAMATQDGKHHVRMGANARSALTLAEAHEAAALRWRQVAEERKVVERRVMRAVEAAMAQATTGSVKR